MAVAAGTLLPRQSLAAARRHRALVLRRPLVATGLLAAGKSVSSEERKVQSHCALGSLCDLLDACQGEQRLARHPGRGGEGLSGGRPACAKARRSCERARRETQLGLVLNGRCTVPGSWDWVRGRFLEGLGQGTSVPPRLRLSQAPVCRAEAEKGPRPPRAEVTRAGAGTATGRQEGHGEGAVTSSGPHQCRAAGGAVAGWERTQSCGSNGVRWTQQHRCPVHHPLSFPLRAGQALQTWGRALPPDSASCRGRRLSQEPRPPSSVRLTWRVRAGPAASLLNPSDLGSLLTLQHSGSLRLESQEL